MSRFIRVDVQKAGKGNKDKKVFVVMCDSEGKEQKTPLSFFLKRTSKRSLRNRGTTTAINHLKGMIARGNSPIKPEDKKRIHYFWGENYRIQQELKLQKAKRA